MRRVKTPSSTPVGSSPAFCGLIRALERLGPLHAPVFLTGETGSGKEIAARVLHQASDRGHRPLVALNCAAIAQELACSQLFGHLRGAFTGAERTRAGAFKRADGSTLFLDEVAELPLEVQTKLLRVLETGTIQPVGAEVEVEVDVRVVAATCQDVRTLVEQGAFREDLYHRLGVFVVHVPPLRDRLEDVPALVRHFGRQAAAELGRPVTITGDAVAEARRRPWPGNLRQLRNAVFRAAALGDGPVDRRALLAALEPDAPPTGGPITVPRGSYHAMRAALVQSVVAEEGSVRRAAAVLGVPRTTLGNWLRRAG